MGLRSDKSPTRSTQKATACAWVKGNMSGGSAVRAHGSPETQNEALQFGTTPQNWPKNDLNWGVGEGTRTPYWDCMGSSNNLVPRGAKLSATDVTLKVFFEPLYSFQDWAHLSPESTVRVLPHPHCSLNNYFSISIQFFRMWPLIFVSTRFTK